MSTFDVWISGFVFIGLFNGLAISLWVLSKKEVTRFCFLISLSLLLFTLDSLREYFYVFGSYLNFRPKFLDFQHFSLLIPGFVFWAYTDLSIGDFKGKLWIFLPWALELIFVLLLRFSVIPIYSFINAHLPLFINLIALGLWGVVYFSKNILGNFSKRVLKFYVLAAVCSLLINAGVLISRLLDSSDVFTISLYLNFIIKSFFIYILAFSLFIQFRVNLVRKKHLNLQVVSKKLGNDIFEKINTDKPFLEKGLTIEKLANIYGTDSKTLSSNIKDEFGMSFNDYINNLRLEFFISLVENKEYEKMTLVGMAESSGFNSKSTFNRVFKAKFDCTPSEFVKRKR